jgi:tRNA(Ile)-lysidine synthase
VQPTLDQVVAAFFGRHALTGGGVVALSGGPDSVCLALILRDLHRQGVFPKLVLAHLNHQQRGADSAADEAFVQDLSVAWNLPCRTERVDVAAAAEQARVNLEATARRLRYSWLARVARDEGAAWVAAGHSADDQAETVLFRMLRGSGLQGLSGMADRRVLALSPRSFQ